MTLSSLQLAALLLVVALLTWLVWKRWPQRTLPSSLPVSEPLAKRIHQIRAQTIMAQGGPRSFAEYLAIFPTACPECGSRTIYEAAMVTSLPAGELPLTTPAYRVDSCWWCPRCHTGSDTTLEKAGVRQQISSPYLDAALTDTIPEPPYPKADVKPVPSEPVAAHQRSKIYIENDDVTPMDFVVIVLGELFELSSDRAIDVMIQAHQEGRSLIATCSEEEADHLVASAHAIAKEAGYPLRFVITPEKQSTMPGDT
jgi:ATP-dependent Clp protease adaptor protein ClpS